MGFLDSIFRKLGLSKPPAAKIVCVGLDNSGKTTLLNTLKTEKTQTDASDIVPTGSDILFTFFKVVKLTHSLPIFRGDDCVSAPCQRITSFS